MAKKRQTAPPTPPPQETPPRAGVTAERFTRLYRLLHLLARKPQPRETLAQKLSLDVRGFYRDLEVLRRAGISVTLADGRYALAGPVAAAEAKLPFPDPLFTLGEARQLAKGRGACHLRLRQQLEEAGVNSKSRAATAR
jgi:predicted DNA-binding transcriptional regulator YafY